MACLPAVELIIALGVWYVLRSELDFCSVWPSFLGAQDFRSDWTFIILLEPSNPWKIFWVTLISLILSTGVSIAIAIWFGNKTGLKPAYIVWLCLTSSTEVLKKEERFRNGEIEPEVKKLCKLNYINVLLLENLPMSVVKIILFFTAAASSQTVDLVIMAQVNN